MTSYKDYVSDESYHLDYAEYQRRYATQLRESDRVLIEIVRELVAERGPLHLLDIGCSTGNLLLHLRNELPQLKLRGGDLVPAVLEECRSNELLKGISFESLDVLDLPANEELDIVVANAVLYVFSRSEFERAIASISRALGPTGSLAAFDFFHPFRQNLEIVERSEKFPNGHALHFRPFAEVEPVLRANGFDRVEFRPFQIPVDLPRPQSDEDISSYTVRDDSGGRLLYRGALSQPWCHLLATKGL